MSAMDLTELKKQISRTPSARASGRVVGVDSAIVWIKGLSHLACIGDRLRLYSGDETITGEVLRIKDDQVAMLPDEGADGIALGNRVVLLGAPVISPADSWIGRIVDPYGTALDGFPIQPGPVARPYRSRPPKATMRRGLGPRLRTGLAVFDTILPIVTGQRIGLFAGSGVGKSTLLAELTRGMEADVVVLALVGERGREVRDYVANVLGPEGMKRSVVVAATSDRSPTERRRCPLAAMTVAEHFRDQGKHVLLLVDSITRFAEAHREVVIASGELPAMRGYPPSISNQIMRLAERAGPGIDGQGDITGVFSVLVAGSDMDEPVADILRGVLDGHVVLDRQIAERGRYPAIDVLKSVSRSLPEAASEFENTLIHTTRNLLGRYEKSETLIRAGLYKEGSDSTLDQAVRAWPGIDDFIGEHSKQGKGSAFGKLQIILSKAGVQLPMPQRDGRKRAG